MIPDLFSMHNDLHIMDNLTETTNYTILLEQTWNLEQLWEMIISFNIEIFHLN